MRRFCLFPQQIVASLTTLLPLPQLTLLLALYLPLFPCRALHTLALSLACWSLSSFPRPSVFPFLSRTLLATSATSLAQAMPAAGRTSRTLPWPTSSGRWFLLLQRRLWQQRLKCQLLSRFFLLLLLLLFLLLLFLLYFLLLLLLLLLPLLLPRKRSSLRTVSLSFCLLNACDCVFCGGTRAREKVRVTSDEAGKFEPAGCSARRTAGPERTR